MKRLGENVRVLSAGEKPTIERGDDVDKHRAEPGWFVGRFVKLRFVAGCCGRVEYMWVKVTEHDSKDCVLHSRLAQDPIFVDAKDGDPVVFTPDEILDVYDPIDVLQNLILEFGPAPTAERELRL